MAIPVAFASAFILKPYEKSFKGPTLINESLTANEKDFCSQYITSSESLIHPNIIENTTIKLEKKVKKNT